jgi:hypothetical protein
MRDIEGIISKVNHVLPRCFKPNPSTMGEGSTNQNHRRSKSGSQMPHDTVLHETTDPPHAPALAAEWDFPHSHCYEIDPMFHSRVQPYRDDMLQRDFHMSG